MTKNEKMAVSILKREKALIPYIKERRKHMPCGSTGFFVYPNAAFVWKNTAEGIDYWKLIQQKFINALRNAH